MKISIHLDDPSGCSGYKVYSLVGTKSTLLGTFYEDDVEYLLDRKEAGSILSDYELFERGLVTTFSVHQKRVSKLLRNRQSKYSLQGA